MAPAKPSGYQNRILAKLSAAELGALEPLLSAVALPQRQDCEKPHKPIRYAYFPEAGIASVVANGNGELVEVGMIGREGMTGLMVVMGNDRSPHHTYIQVAGEGYRIAADDLRRFMKVQPAARELFLRYAQAFMIQTAHTALANGRANLEARLARWLLMAHDRIGKEELALIHEFLALMLGVHRPGVTVAIQGLQRKGLIAAGRGSIVVLDRENLEVAAHGLYGTPEKEYERLLGER